MSPLCMLLTLLHSSSMMPWLFVLPAPVWEETNVASVLGVCKAQGKAGKENGIKWDKMSPV